MTSFALRLPSALATIALAAMTGYAVARQAGTRVGIYASVILSSCLMVAVIGRLAIMDALLDLTVAMTIFWWFRGLETGRDRYVVYGWIAAGFGFLAKGLGGTRGGAAGDRAVLRFGTIDTRRRRLPHGARVVAGVDRLCASSWFRGRLALVWHYHLFPLEKLFGHYTIERYTGVIENQSGPIWYYVPVLLLGFFPWTAFLPMAVVYGLRQLRALPQDPHLASLVRLAFDVDRRAAALL